MSRGILLSGDSKGILRTWDVRNGDPVDSLLVGDQNCAVSSISFSKSSTTENDHGRYMALNCYDNGSNTTIDPVITMQSLTLSLTFFCCSSQVL